MLAYILVVLSVFFTLLVPGPCAYVFQLPGVDTGSNVSSGNGGGATRAEDNVSAGRHTRDDRGPEGDAIAAKSEGAQQSPSGESAGRLTLVRPGATKSVRRISAVYHVEALQSRGTMVAVLCFEFVGLPVLACVAFFVCVCARSPWASAERVPTSEEAAAAAVAHAAAQLNSPNSPRCPGCMAINLELRDRKRAAMLLCVGALFGLSGFITANLIGLMRFWLPNSYDSHPRDGEGFAYFPASISEMVHNFLSPAGKCFFAFEFCAALFIFMSWYPMMLRNIYTSDTATRFFGMSLPTVRQFGPALGLMLVAGVTTRPMVIATPLDFVSSTVHTIGVVMLFVGYFISEAALVGWSCIPAAVPAANVGEREGMVRVALLYVIIWSCPIFAVLQIVLNSGLLPICCYDEWDAWTASNGNEDRALVIAASELVLVLKVLCYVSECICGVALILSHLCIWYFCEERHIELKMDVSGSVTIANANAKSICFVKQAAAA